MAIIFDLDESKKLSPKKIEQIRKKINDLSDEIYQKFSSYVKFLENQELKKNYFEIHQPFFDNELTIIMSKPTNKFLISVLDHRNHRVCGNLILEKVACLTVSQTKDLSEWSNFKYGKNLSNIFQFLPEKVKKIINKN